MKKEKKDKHFIKKPVYDGGPRAMKEFIRKNLKYPKEALKNRLEGTVRVRFSINHKGRVTDAQVQSGLGSGCDEEAMRLVKLLKFRVPKTRNLKVLFHKTLNIHFRLPKSPPVKAASFSYRYIPKRKEEPGSDVDSGTGSTIIYRIERKK